MIVELSICRLRPGKGHEEYLQVARSLRAFLAIQPGFVSHELCVSEQEWAQRTVWRSLEEARNAAQRLAENELAWELSELVETQPRTFIGRRLDNM